MRYTYEQTKTLTQEQCNERDDYDISDYCNKIIDKSFENGFIGRHKVYKLENGYYISLWVNEVGSYLGGCQYKKDLYDMWTWSNVRDFYNNYLDNKELKFEIISFRKYREPKLTRPKELKGIKQAYTVDYIPKKCKCQVFIKDNDVYVKHNDYFSPSMEEPIEDFGTPLEYRIRKYGINPNKSNKFAYPDAWGDIVLRQQAWIKISNLKFIIDRGDFQLDILHQILRLQEQYHKMKYNELEIGCMARMWENLINIIRNDKENVDE